MICLIIYMYIFHLGILEYFYWVLKIFDTLFLRILCSGNLKFSNNCFVPSFLIFIVYIRYIRYVCSISIPTSLILSTVSNVSEKLFQRRTQWNGQWQRLLMATNYLCYIVESNILHNFLSWRYYVPYSTQQFSCFT